MFCRRTPWITGLLVLAVSAPLSADKIRMRSGKVAEGTFIGADSKSVRLLLDNGQVSEMPIERVFP